MERCQECGCLYDDVWRTTDEAWIRVTGITDGSGLLCMPCFCGMAKEQGIELYWDAVIPTPQDVGIEFIQSPHYNWRPSGTKIWAIVVHATANSTLEGVIRWFTNPAALVSAHYNIGKDGRVVQMVQDERRAWHAGKSTWKGVYNVNDYSLGIELVNKNDGEDPYPEAQYRALVVLCMGLIAKYDVQIENIMGHKDVSLSGKVDPMGFDLERLRRELET